MIEAPSSRGKMRDRATLLRLAVAAGLVTFLLWYTGPGRILGTLRSADLPLLGAAFALMCCYSGVKAWTWQLLLTALGVKRPRQFRGVAACYLTSSMFGSVVPSSASTDAIRAVLAHRRFGGGFSLYLASVVVLNALNLVAACALGLIAIILLGISGSVPRIALLAAPLFCGVIGGAIAVHVLLKRRRDWWFALLRLAPRPLLRVRRPLRRFTDQLLVFERTGVAFGPIFMTSLLAQFGFVCTLALVGAAVGIDLDFLIWPIYAPLVSMSALIPASVSGFGAEQAAYVYVMSLAGVAEAQAFVASALFSMLYLLFNLGIGGIAYVLSPSRVDAAIMQAGRSVERSDVKV